MLELKTYKKKELSTYLGSADKQAIERKLKSYGVDYSVSGRGDNALFTIKNISDPFKVHCVFDLHYPPQTDFKKLMYFLYYLLCDDDFRKLPVETMALKLEEKDHNVSRQTIRTYLSRLDKTQMIHLNSCEYVYYFARGKEYRYVERAEYSRAWREYWQNKENGCSAEVAIFIMCCDYGGVARKQEIVELNGIFKDGLNFLVNLVCDAVEKSLSEKQG